MTNTTLRGVTAALVLIAGLGSAAAQESTNVVATEGDWTVFAAENPKEQGVLVILLRLICRYNVEAYCTYQSHV